MSLNLRNKLGYYETNGLVFTEKLHAVLYASEHNTDVIWKFNDEVFDRVDWKTEPELGLDAFYKIRAQQIRDDYDYVIVMCSGGADSTNVIWSFLRNNIPVDEVIASAPISGLRTWADSSKNVSAANTISETMLVQLPLMDEIHSKHPEVRITINDYFDTMLNYKTDDWIFKCGEWIHPSSSARYDLNKHSHIRKLAEQGKKIAIVYGIDKPRLSVSPTGQYLTNLTDIVVNVQRPAFNDKYENVCNVLFYYTPDLPLMMVKQAHTVAKWINSPAGLFSKQTMANKDYAKFTYEGQKIRNSFHQRAIVPCIYPTTHSQIFQAHKPTKNFLGEHDAWFYDLCRDTIPYQRIESDFLNFFKQIHPRFLYPGKFDGLRTNRLAYDIGVTELIT